MIQRRFGNLTGSVDEEIDITGTLKVTDDIDLYQIQILSPMELNGTATIDSTGNWTYAPNTNFNGTDTLR